MVHVDAVKMLRKLKGSTSNDAYAEFEEELRREFRKAGRPHLPSRANLGAGVNVLEHGS